MGRITDDPWRIRVVGLCLLVGGVALLVYGPYYRANSHAHVPNPQSHALFGDLGRSEHVVVALPLALLFYLIRFLSTVTVIPAALAVWGASMLWTGKIRSVTPAWAAAAIPLALAPVAVLVHIEPVGAGACDVSPCTNPIRPEWTAPSGVFEVAAAMLREGAVAYGAAGFFLFGSVANAGERSGQWVPAVFLYVVVWTTLLLFTAPGLVGGMVLWLAVAGVLALPLWRFGQWIAAPADASAVPDDSSVDVDAAVG